MPLFGFRNAPANGRVHTASAAGIDRRTAEDMTRLRQEWQDRALLYYDTVPEVWFASHFYSRALARIRLFPARRQPDGTSKPAEDTQLDELWNRIQDEAGGRSLMFGNYGVLMFVVGECILLGTSPEEDTENWEIVSTKELTITDTTIVRRDSDGGEPTEYRRLEPGADSLGRNDAVAYRMWRRHPKKSKLADSPLRASLDICEELVLLTLGIRARIRSRLSGAGILAIDSEVTLPAADEQDETDEDAFIRKLGEHLMEPIGDEGSASAVVPYLMRVPTGGRKIADLIEHIRVHEPNEEFPERGMREEAVKRLATGLDLPPELLLGLSGANHWTSWQIDEQSWELLQPTVQQMADDFAGAYLRPAARDDNVTDWEEITLGYDKAEIVNKPDRSKDAAQAHDRLAISDEALRLAGGWKDDDAPQEEELKTRLAVKMRQPGMLPDNLRPEQPEPQPGQIQNGAQPEGERGPPPNQPDKPPGVRGAPGSNPSRSENTLGTTTLILGASEYAIERARELAGSRIRTRLRTCGPCMSAAHGVPNALVASVLGTDVTADAGTSMELVNGAGLSLARMLSRRGIDTPVAAQIGDYVEQHAAETLHLAEPPALDLTELLAKTE